MAAPEWDWRVLGSINALHSPAFSDRVIVLDVAWDSDRSTDRRRVAAVLDRLVSVNQRPGAVMLDIEFDPCATNPCGEPMESARRVLAASIRAATANFPVYAMEQPTIDHENAVIGPVEPHDALLYDALTGAAHTRFIVLPNAAGVFYRGCALSIPTISCSLNAAGLSVHGIESTNNRCIWFGDVQ